MSITSGTMVRSSDLLLRSFDEAEASDTSLYAGPALPVAHGEGTATIYQQKVSISNEFPLDLALANAFRLTDTIVCPSST